MEGHLKQIRHYRQLLNKYASSLPPACNLLQDVYFISLLKRIDWHAAKHRHALIRATMYLSYGNPSNEDFLKYHETPGLVQVALHHLSTEYTSRSRKLASDANTRKTGRTEKYCDYFDNVNSCLQTASLLSGGGLTVIAVKQGGKVVFKKVVVGYAAGYGVAEGMEVIYDIADIGVETREKIDTTISVASLILSVRQLKCDRKRRGQKDAELDTQRRQEHDRKRREELDQFETDQAKRDRLYKEHEERKKKLEQEQKKNEGEDDKTSTTNADDGSVEGDANVPQPTQTIPGNSKTRQAIKDTIQDVRSGVAGDVEREGFQNLGQGEGGRPLLPTDPPPGGKPPQYEEYAVVSSGLRTGNPVPAGHLGDRRIIYDRSNDRIFYTSNIHQNPPVYIELVDQ